MEILFQFMAALVTRAACLCLGLSFLGGGLMSVSAQQGEMPVPAGSLERHYFSQPHLGTTVQIAFYSKDGEAAQKLATQCFERVQILNAVFSDYLPDSEVSRLCSKPVQVAHKVSDDLFAVIAQAQEISQATDGAFDITLGNATQKWREKSARRKSPPAGDSAPVETVATYQDVFFDPKTKTVKLRTPLKIDLGGIAKGYIADQLMVILSKAGIKQAAVVIGGEMVFSGAPPGKEGWTVGVERPSFQILGILTMKNSALSTSGDSYQFFEQNGVRHAHLIDPATRKSKSNRLNVTTIASSAMLADAWATALRVTGREGALKLANKTKGIEAAFIPFGKDAVFTSGFPKLKKP